MPTIDLNKVSDATLVALVCFVPPEEHEASLPDLAYRELHRRGLARPFPNPLNTLSPTRFPDIFCLASLNLIRLSDALDFLQDFYFGVD